MERFCIVANAEKDINYQTAEYIRSFLETKGKKCFLVRDRFIKEDSKKYIGIEELHQDIDCIIILGGDGTMIQAANDFHSRNIPFLGVNLGTLGFLTEVEKQDIESSLEELFAGNYKIEKRLMLEGKIERKGSLDYVGTAINDFVISRSGTCRLITLEVFVDEEFIDRYVADGIIVSTSTGSTGYNLSAGGPVLAPEVQAIIITPICPHSLNKRSLVVPSDSKVIVRVGKSKELIYDRAMISSDGNEILQIKSGEEIQIVRAFMDAKIVKLSGFSFFKRMRQKLSREV